MRQKYSTIAAANRAWGTRFADWSEVEPPRPGEHPGGLWNDALAWYRDSRAAVDRWQVGNYLRAVQKYAPASHRPVVIIMVAGAHIAPAVWTGAVQSAMPSCSLNMMSDSEFAMDLAKQTGCWLQYTGATDAAEVRLLRQYMRTHNITEPMWGENAGIPRAADNPALLVDVVLANGLYGLDYVSSRFLFDRDGITPNVVFDRLAAASRHFIDTVG